MTLTASLPKLLTLREAARVLRVEPKTLLNGWSRGTGPWCDLPRTRVGAKVLIPLEAVRAVIASGEESGTRRPPRGRLRAIVGAPATKGRAERSEHTTKEHGR